MDESQQDPRTESHWKLCPKKRPFATREAARRAKRKLQSKKIRLSVYKCRACNLFHLGNKGETVEHSKLIAYADRDEAVARCNDLNGLSGGGFKVVNCNRCLNWHILEVT